MHGVVTEHIVTEHIVTEHLHSLFNLPDFLYKAGKARCPASSGK